jgi:hypothetical protein
MLCRGADWATDDPLGIGTLLISAYRLTTMILKDGVEDGESLGRILAAAEVGLAAYARGDPLAEPAARRLAFRELGLALGLHALERMLALAAGSQRLPKRLADLARYLPLAGRIDAFWCAAVNRQARSWLAHGDINAVMLATCLAPSGYLGS